MKSFAQRLALPAALAAALFGTSCAAPLVVGAFGGLVGVWVYDDFSKDRAEVLLHVTPERLFSVAEATVNARSDVENLEVTRGSFRITFDDARGKLSYNITVMIVPGSPDYATLRVYAAELKVRGRAEEARALADQIVARL